MTSPATAVPTAKRPKSHPRPMARFAVAGWGTALPERRVTNDDLAAYLDTSDEWISSRTGIRERRVGAPDESTATLAIAAARRALDAARMRPVDLDAVVLATSTPEQPVPSTAASVTASLGITAGAMDLNAACAGFVYGLVVAGALVETGASRSVLLIGADTMTRFVDPTDRATAVLFGDGAGAVVLTHDSSPTAPSAAAGGLLACDLVGDPGAFDSLLIPAGGSACPPSIETVQAGGHYLRMDGSEVFRRAVRAVADSIARTLERAGCGPDDIDLFVPHQANSRIIDAVLDRVGIPHERTLQTVDRHGNTSSASVPLAVGETGADKGLPDGALVLTSGFGAGLTVGTGLLRWQASRRGTTT